MLPEVDDITLYILKKLSEYESVKEAGSVKFVIPCASASDAVLCISYRETLWQDLDYRLKLMKYYGLLQHDETPDPDVGVTYVCISALGRRLMYEGIEKKVDAGKG